MVRVKRGNVARNRRKKILKFAKGFKGAHSRLFRTANQQVMKALIYSYVGRKRRKRDFKRLWLCRVNAAARIEGCLLYTSPSPRDATLSRMPSSA